MKTITFVNGSTLEATDASTIYDVIVVYATGEEMLSAWANFTKDNMTTVLVNNETFHNIIPVNISASIDDESGVYIVHFINRATTDMELMEQAIKDNQDAIAELGELVG